MYIEKTFTICAAHLIPGHPKCGNLHGHNFKITIEYHGQLDKQTGMLLDFAAIKRVVNPIIERLDHRNLNYYLKVPTAENLAAYFAHELAAELGLNITVRVNETDPTEAVFTGPDDFLTYDTYDGHKPPFDKIPVFRTMRDRAMWARQQKAKLESIYVKMHEVGAKLAAFEVYKASLDELEAAKLLSELRGLDSIPEEKK